jgi:predicted RNA-binding Zn-ribbon protein involved in translation (DUF1610 family)
MRLRLMQLAASPSEHADFLTCPRCGTQMPKVVTIVPMGRQPGLVAYECPKCVYVTSVLVSAAGPSTARCRGHAVNSPHFPSAQHWSTPEHPMALAKAGERNPDALCEQVLKDIRTEPA